MYKCETQVLSHHTDNKSTQYASLTFKLCTWGAPSSSLSSISMGLSAPWLMGLFLLDRSFILGISAGGVLLNLIVSTSSVSEIDSNSSVAVVGTARLRPKNVVAFCCPVVAVALRGFPFDFFSVGTIQPISILELPLVHWSVPCS